MGFTGSKGAVGARRWQLLDRDDPAFHLAYSQRTQEGSESEDFRVDAISARVGRLRLQRTTVVSVETGPGRDDYQ